MKKDFRPDTMTGNIVKDVYEKVGNCSCFTPVGGYIPHNDLKIANLSSSNYATDDENDCKHICLADSNCT